MKLNAVTSAIVTLMTLPASAQEPIPQKLEAHPSRTTIELYLAKRFANCPEGIRFRRGDEEWQASRVQVGVLELDNLTNADRLNGIVGSASFEIGIPEMRQRVGADWGLWIDYDKFAERVFVDAFEKGTTITYAVPGPDKRGERWLGEAPTRCADGTAPSPGLIAIEWFDYVE